MGKAVEVAALARGILRDALDAPEQWNERTARRAATELDRGFGVSMTDYRLRPGGRIEIVHAVGAGDSDIVLEASSGFARALPPALVSAIFGRAGVMVASETGVDRLPAWKAWCTPRGMEEGAGVRVVDEHSACGVLLGVGAQSAGQIGAQVLLRTLDSVLHYGARLRAIARALGAAPIDAIISTCGRVEQHGWPARAGRAEIDRLQAAARRLEARRDDWTLDDVLEGRWMLVDRRDRRGEVHWLVLRVDDTMARVVRLTGTERRVAAWAGRGGSLEELAEDWGVSRSSIATHLRRALIKLGIPDRTALIRLWACVPSVGTEAR